MDNKWLIDVAAWGQIIFVGTEEEAEEWRVHKSNWEGCIATKRRAAPGDLAKHRFIYGGEKRE